MPTKTEQKVLNFITHFIEDNQVSPTFEEIGEAIHVSSRGTVHRYVSSLCKQGYLLKGDGKRSLKVPGKGVLPYWGKIAAGRPIEAVPDIDHIDVDELFMGGDRYILKVKGDSMVEAGILHDDFVVIEKANTAENNQIVVALIENQDASLKRFRKYKDGRIKLIPENRTMESMIYKAEQVAIQGILVGVLRTY